MDLPTWPPGAVAYFPVSAPTPTCSSAVPHGRQGDGELCGVAVEIPTTVEIAVRPDQGR